jgi:hypothetical protein
MGFLLSGKKAHLLAPCAREARNHPIIAMQCGPIRFRADARSEAAKWPFAHLVRIRPKAFKLPASIGVLA